MMLKNLSGGTAILFFTLSTASAQVSEFSGLRQSSALIARIEATAKYVAKQSTPACTAAPCVKGNCSTMGNIAMPIRRVEVLLTAYQKQLEQWKDLRTKSAENFLFSANVDQAKIDELTDLQLLQDVLQTIGKAFAEAASWQDFIASYGEKLGEVLTREFTWKTYKFLESHFKRFEVVLDKILEEDGGDNRVKSEARKIARVVHDVLLNLYKLKEILKQIDEMSDSGKTKGVAPEYIRKLRAKRNLRIGRLLKTILDVKVGMERQKRLAKIQGYMDSNLEQHSRALKELQIARQINDLIEGADNSKLLMRDALRGVTFCMQRICKASLPKASAITLDPTPKTATAKIITFFNSKLRAMEKDMERAAGRYKIAADFTSNVILRKSIVSPLSNIRAKYRIAKMCIPKDARFQVFRREDTKRKRPVMELERIKRPDGKLKFRVSEDLSGEWTDEKKRRYKIVVKGNDITFTYLNMPMRGRNRTYSGTFDGVPTRPGDYELVLYSKKKQEFYLPTNFTVEQKNFAKGKQISLSNTPASIKDLNPRMSIKKRNAVLKRVLSKRLSYKVKLKPMLSSNGEVRVSAEFWSYRFRWNETKGKLHPEPFKNKLSRKATLRISDQN